MTGYLSMTAAPTAGSLRSWLVFSYLTSCGGRMPEFIAYAGRFSSLDEIVNGFVGVIQPVFGLMEYIGDKILSVFSGCFPDREVHNSPAAIPNVIPDTKAMAPIAHPEGILFISTSLVFYVCWPW